MRRFFGALLPFFVCIPLLAQRVKVYQIEVAPSDRRLEGRSTIELKDGSGAPRTIVFERTRKERALPVIDAVLLDGTCDPASTEANGCERASIDLTNGHVETRSFALGKGIVLDLEGLGTLMEDVPLRITSRRTKATPHVDVRITTRSAPAESERVTYRADVGSRSYSVTADYRAPRSVATLAPLVALLHDVLAGESVVPFATTAPVDTGTGTPGSSDGDRVCSICDFCSKLPGGDTVRGCLGEGGLLGGGGGGGGTTAPGPCTISSETALRVLRDVLFSDFTDVRDLCKFNIHLRTSGFTTAFSADPAHFKAARDAAPDPGSRGCAACFFDKTRPFDSGGTARADLRAALGVHCDKNYFALVAHPAEYAKVTAIAQRFINDTSACKNLCDGIAPPTGGPAPTAAPHRAYCVCRPDYLAWEPAGPRPSSGVGSCPP